MPPNDDGSSPEVFLDFELNFFGDVYDSLWINNNGNVTLDGPLGEYTPFDLSTTDRAIIAPYFADVDTRAAGGGVVFYNYGAGAYQGQRAFCVTWYQVGYYSQSVDKVNTFQLLLVERPESGPGDFDIIFNYDSLQWETGDASNGSGGTGGWSARAGFSNGLAQGPDQLYQRTSIELAGSGVPGEFLDSSPSGLARTATFRQPVGRHIFPVRSNGVIGTQYVALGDSYQAGEGAGSYRQGTNTTTNQCHRSNNSYPVLLAGRRAIPYNLDFWACAGSFFNDLERDTTSTQRPPWNDPAWNASSEAQYKSALERVGHDTQVITIGIGGNDVGFFPVLTGCIAENLTGASDEVPCAGRHDSQVQAALDELADVGKWTTIFKDLRRRAPWAEIYAISYPRFFAEDNYWGDCEALALRPADQRWINSTIDRLNANIKEGARAANVRYVDLADAGAGHEICSGDRVFMNLLDPIFTEANPLGVMHPNAFGQELMADAIEAQLDVPGPWIETTVFQGQSTFVNFDIDSAATASFSQWMEGSIIDMRVTSPSGQVYDKNTVGPGIRIEHGPTFDYFDIDNPEPGEWTVELVGVEVAPAGEWSYVDAQTSTVRNTAPVAALDVSNIGWTYTFDATASTDVDGQIVSYEWDLGNGERAVGPLLQREFVAGLEFWPTLIVTDDVGAESYLSPEVGLKVPDLNFAGFSAPDQGSRAHAGRTIPVRFSFHDYYGTDLFRTDFATTREIDCDSQAPRGNWEQASATGHDLPKYHPGAGDFQWLLKTSKSWQGSCQELRLTLVGESSYSVWFDFS